MLIRSKLKTFEPLVIESCLIPQNDSKVLVLSDFHTFNVWWRVCVCVCVCVCAWYLWYKVSWACFEKKELKALFEYSLHPQKSLHC